VQKFGGICSQGVTVPAHACCAVSQVQPGSLRHVAESVAVAHGAGVPAQPSCQVQPLTALQRCGVRKFIHEGAVPEHVEEGMSHEQPCPMQLPSSPQLLQGLVVPVHAIWVSQPGQSRQERFFPQSAQVEYFGIPWQPVRLVSTEQPMQLIQVMPAVIAHWAHVARVGVPPHSIPVRNVRGGGGRLTPVVVQQTNKPQSALVEHCLGQVSAHRPLQQSCPVALQSADVAQATGQASNFGLRQTPLTLSAGSATFADAQQASPVAASQSDVVVHAFGHRVPGKQKLFA
jgi:hypothetical protein